MKVAIMQPYFFPYISYFQLINAVDEFVVYDDVNYIKKGWINRNNILVNNGSFLFKIPLIKSSQNKLINQISIDNNENWKLDLLKTIEYSYKKAPYFENVFPIIKEILFQEKNDLSKFLVFSLKLVCNYLNIKTKIILSSSIEKNNDLKGQDKIIEICKKLNATTYINAIGGQELYNKNDFSKNNIALNFIHSDSISYDQFKNQFIPYLSIIDVMMFNSLDDIKEMFSKYELL